MAKTVEELRPESFIQDEEEQLKDWREHPLTQKHFKQIFHEARSAFDTLKGVCQHTPDADVRQAFERWLRLTAILREQGLNPRFGP